jgi:Tfp pilus assembly protein PilF
MEGQRLPSKGDPVKIFGEVPGLGKVPLQGNWTVARIDGNTVIAECEGGSSAQPSAGQSVTIESTGPAGPVETPGKPKPPADATPVQPDAPGHNGRPETRVYPPPMVQRRPGPVPEDEVRGETDRESNDHGQNDTGKPSTGRYLPGCDASEASKEKCKLADKVREQRRFDEAIRLYNEAIQLDRGHVCAYTGIGWSLGLSGQTQSGMDQMNRTVDMFPDSAKALLERGAYATRINRIDIAEADADRAILLSYCAQAYELRAYCYLERGRDQSAINYLDMAIKVFPHSANAYRLRARAHRGLRNYSQAARDDAQAQQLERDQKR